MSQPHLSICIPIRKDGGQYERLFDWVVPAWRAFGPEIEVCVGEDDGVGLFNCAMARNNAVKQATADDIWLCDTDVYPDFSVVREFLEHRPDELWGFPYNTYSLMTEEATERVLASQPGTQFNLTAVDRIDGVTTYQGIRSVYYMTREIYWFVGGSDEKFRGWGWEDVALMACFQNLYGPLGRTKSRAHHLYHRFGEWDDPNYSDENRLKNPARLLCARYARLSKKGDVRAIRRLNQREHWYAMSKTAKL
jgi:hypothetical protein